MQIEYALIADHAEIVAGKLYLMGGGWDTFGAAETPAPMRFALALGVRVGWEETNLPIPVRAHVEDDDGKELMRIEATLNVGRPPGLPPGSGQLAQLAASINLSVPAFGGYRLRVAAGEGERLAEQLLPFRVVQRVRPGTPPAQ